MPRGKRHETPELTEENELTRCLCGQDDPPDNSGLYIQCETCSVWQHGACVGMEEESDVPDVYFCEQCRPDLHTIVEEHGDVTSIYAPVVKKTRKRRRHVEEEEEPIKNDRRRATSSARVEKQYQLMLEKAMEESKKEPAKVESPEPVQEPEVEVEKPEEEKKKKKEEMPEDTKVKEESVKEAKKKPVEAEAEVEAEVEAEAEVEEPKVELPAPKRKGRGKRAKTSPPTSSGTGINKPIKPRLPTQRTSLNEMRRRVSAILEFITRTQYEIAMEQDGREELVKFVENEEFVHQVDKIFDGYNESLSMMEDLAKRLLGWEQTYGVE